MNIVGGYIFVYILPIIVSHFTGTGMFKSSTGYFVSHYFYLVIIKYQVQQPFLKILNMNQNG